MSIAGDGGVGACGGTFEYAWREAWIMEAWSRSTEGNLVGFERG